MTRKRHNLLTLCPRPCSQSPPVCSVTRHGHRTQPGLLRAPDRQQSDHDSEHHNSGRERETALAVMLAPRAVQ
jgi:hypothetical protein